MTSHLIKLNKKSNLKNNKRIKLIKQLDYD